jgi:hypothetical protein
MRDVSVYSAFDTLKASAIAARSPASNDAPDAAPSPMESAAKLSGANSWPSMNNCWFIALNHVVCPPAAMSR